MCKLIMTMNLFQFKIIGFFYMALVMHLFQFKIIGLHNHLELSSLKHILVNKIYKDSFRAKILRDDCTLSVKLV